MIRDSWLVARGSWFVTRGSWLVIRGSCLVVRASWFVGAVPKGGPLRAEGFPKRRCQLEFVAAERRI